MTNPLSELSAIVEAVPPGTKCRVQLVHEADGHVIPNGAVAAYVETGTRLTRWLCSPGAVEELGRATRNAWIMAKVPREGEIVTAETIWTRVGDAALSTIAQHALEERT